MAGLRLFPSRLTPTAVRQEMARAPRDLKPAVGLLQSQVSMTALAKVGTQRLEPRHTEGLRLDTEFSVSLWMRSELNPVTLTLTLTLIISLWMRSDGKDGTLLSRSSAKG